jgi:pyruvate dehydrogenase (quinone)
MLMGEVATLVKYNLPVKVLIIKNNTLGQIKWEQIVLSATPEFGVNLQPIDFAAYAKACGVAGYCIEDPKQCETVLREAFAQPGPAVVEAVVDANEPPLPGKIKTQQALHFAQALLKGQPDKWNIISNAMKDVIGQKVREVV